VASKPNVHSKCTVLNHVLPPPTDRPQGWGSPPSWMLVPVPVPAPS
jgi:hypothetical protein